jgi:uncharacterized membrane protein YgaE (UPF0421/DUF939 family)
MSSFVSSSFNSARARIQGTALGAVFGVLITTWIPIRDFIWKMAALSLWVFVCGFNK